MKTKVFGRAGLHGRFAEGTQEGSAVKRSGCRRRYCGSVDWLSESSYHCIELSSRKGVKADE